jgi:hypothetical protein
VGNYVVEGELFEVGGVDGAAGLGDVEPGVVEGLQGGDALVDVAVEHAFEQVFGLARHVPERRLGVADGLLEDVPASLALVLALEGRHSRQ